MDTKLLARYSQPGPRYTSYPPAPHFSPALTETLWREELRRPSGRDLSLYFHLPFCDSLCYYCGCHMIATQKYSKASRYLDSLLREVDRVAGLLAPGRKVRQMHWGGGTPTFLNPDDIRRLALHARARFDFAADAEVAVEVDPRGLTASHIEALREAGFNRVSLGVQDLDEKVQHAVNRVQPYDLIEEVCSGLRGAGINALNIDLMLGLPHQTPDSFAYTLERVLALKPHRLAVFSYAHVPWLKKHQRLIDEAALPDFLTRLELQNLSFRMLGAAGYDYVGLDHFALPDDELVSARRAGRLGRNFQGYTPLREIDILGFGISAISQTESLYAQNLKGLPEYQLRVDNGLLATERGYRLSSEDLMRRDLIMTLMCDLGLDTAAFGAKWKLDFATAFAPELASLAPLQEDGLVQVQSGRIEVTDSGRVFLRNIAMAFDATLQQATQSGPRYSKTA